MSPRDTLLLERWTAYGDAEAFNQLVAHYAGMVYAVCRRVLRNDADAQDAAQECFLTLAQTKDTIHSSLGGWLHTTATRRALNLLKQNKRRRDRELRYAERQATQTESTWDDIQGFVDEAIAALPEEQRVVIIAHFLERQTGEAIAEAHGITRRAVTYRIQRGVESIRHALSKRGLPIGAGALATALGANTAEAAPATLTAALGRAALAGTQALPKAAMPASLIFAGHGGKAVGALAVLALLLVGLIGLKSMGWGWGSGPKTVTPLVSSRHEGENTGDEREGASPAEDGVAVNAFGSTSTHGAGTGVRAASSTQPGHSSGSPGSPANGAPPPPPPPPVTISGSVIDSEGYPIVGATVAAVNAGSAWVAAAGRPACTAATDSAGLFTIRGVRELGSVVVMASYPGYAAERKRADVSAGVDIENVNFTLKKGSMLYGRVLSRSRAPIGDALVYMQAHILTSGSGASSSELVAVTAKDGRFEAGFHGEGTVGLSVVAKNHGSAFFPSIPIDPAEEIELVMPLPASIEGTISHADGRPAAGLCVSLEGRTSMSACLPGSETERCAEGTVFSVRAYTNAAGHFLHSGLVPDATYYASVLTLHSGKPQELSSPKQVGVAGPGEHLIWDHVLNDFMIVSGRVLDEKNRRSLEGVKIKCERDGEDAGEDHSGGDGSYAMRFFEPGAYTLYPVLPGGEEGGLRATCGKSLAWTPGEKQILNFHVPSPFSMSVHVLDVDGAPMKGVSIRSFRKAGYISTFRTGYTNAEGEYTFGYFAPGLESWFGIEKEGYARRESRHIVGESGVTYPAQVFTLYRVGGMEGRIVDENGAPLSGLNVYLRLIPDESTEPEVLGMFSIPPKAETDENGLFAVAEGLPATTGTLSVWANPSSDIHLHAELPDVECKAGQIINLGDVVLKPKE